LIHKLSLPKCDLHPALDVRQKIGPPKTEASQKPIPMNAELAKHFGSEDDLQPLSLRKTPSTV
jgi:hypothetical protein